MSAAPPITSISSATHEHQASVPTGREHGGDPEADHRQPPDQDAHDHRQALALDPRDPAGEDAADDGAGRDRREQQREGDAALVGPAEATRAAISGNSARGMPKTIAMMSTTNDIISTWCPRR